MTTIDHRRMYGFGRRRRTVKADWFAVGFGLFVTAMLVNAVVDSWRGFTYYPLELLLCIFVGGLSIAGLLMSIARQASVNFVSFAFCLLFFAITPIVQLGADADPIFLVDRWALWSAVSSLLFVVVGLYVTHRMRVPDPQEAQPSRLRPKPTSLNYLLVFMLSAGVALVTIAIFRGDLFTNRDEFGSTFASMFPDSSLQMVGRILMFFGPFFGAIVGLRAAIANGERFWTAMFLFALLLSGVVNNPIINPRYQLAGLVFFAIDYLSNGKRTKLLAIVLVVGVTLAPLFQVFRYAFTDPQDADPFGATTNAINQPFLSMDYDAYQLLCYTMLTVDRDGIAWGSNLLGSVLFFVPRSLWPSKPEQTSWIIYDTISHSRNPGTINLSTPLTAEGYFAFGWAGVIGITIFYWWIISRITIKGRRDPESWAFLWRCCLASLALILLRGTLIVAAGAVVGSFVSSAMSVYLVRFGRWRRSRQYRGFDPSTFAVKSRTGSKL